ncbi:MAG: TAT-variant-translocated molybdopterin oxidoreductase [Akkermansiaceae bacterium]|nr:TAT-variant-translocated molybdopterin oxidoreductase [Akkermansiaceae bacterium]
MSKRIQHHPEVPADETTVSWRSTGQLEDSSEFRSWLEREVPRGAAELANEEEVDNSRRTFMKLMGASTALAGFGMASCRRPESYILPYTEAPEWVIPGKATYYASAMPRAAGATPLVVTTFEGRPTQVAPNKTHPDADGTDNLAQASVLNLYSPYRSRDVLKKGKKAKRKDLDAAIANVAADKKAKIGFVFGADDCPTRTALREKLAAEFGNAKFYSYEALQPEAALGKGVRMVADFDKADRILALDCDFASTDPQGPVTPFFNRRKPEGKDYEAKPEQDRMNRLYAVEAAYSLTGGMADHRLRVAPSQVEVIARAVAAKLNVEPAVKAPKLEKIHQQWVDALAADLQEHASKNPGRCLVLAGSRQSVAVKRLAFAINNALGCIGIGKAMHALQSADTDLDSIEKLSSDIKDGAIDTLVLLTPSNPVFDAPADLEFGKLLGKVKTTIHLGERSDATAHASTWHIPAAHYLESWSDARSARGTYTVVQPMILPLYEDCVSELELLLALLSEDGKLINGEGPEGAASPAYDAVRETFAGIAEGDEAWKQLLRDGFYKGSSYPARKVSDLIGLGVPEAADSKAPTKDSLDVIFATDASILDGRYIDNGWLQEAPDPVSKLTWDNAAMIAPKTAKKLGIYDKVLELQPETKALGFIPVEGEYAAVGPDGEGENRTAPMIELELGGRKIQLPVLISFGQAENTVILPVGYGQGFNEEDPLGRGPKNTNHVGMVGVNSGFDVYPLRTSMAPYFAKGGKVKLIEGRYPLAMTQEHHAMYGRALAREISTMKNKKGDFEAQLDNVDKQGMDSHIPPNISLYKPKGSETWHSEAKAENLLSDPLHQWGMTIDLTSCMGCSACTVACQAENNIPIVGKEQVAMGREMHWIRMDRYYASQSYTFDKQGNKIKDTEKGEYKKAPEWIQDNPAMLPQPVACVQCESAPCETVCPVNATVHTEDGLNAMAYNRCIGTRYCANNCPYKARRFNFFDYNKRNPLIENNLYRGPLGKKDVGGPSSLQKNPNVTVRMRGVMEKCTYCVQRLKDGVIRQKRAQKQKVQESGKLSPEVEVKVDTLRVPTDSIKTACQEACPADAISFGNLLDGKKSKMGRAKEIKRNYDLLNYIGTRPRTSYLARVKNPNPEMPDAPYIGKSTIHMA